MESSVGVAKFLRFEDGLGAAPYELGPAGTTGRVWTAAELEVLTPNERAEIVRAGFVLDPAEVPEHLVERARRKADARIEATERNASTR